MSIDTRVGIEIELESNLHTMTNAYRWASENTNLWEVVADGSLRGGIYGWELRTRGQGIPYPQLLQALHSVSYLLNGNSDTWRAAVHVHADCTSLRPDQLALAYAMSIATDECMFTSTSPHRRESNFCEPVLNQLEECMYVLRRLCSGHERFETNKYSSVNITRLWDLGTIEFRHLQTPAFGETFNDVGAGVRAINSFAKLAATIPYVVKLVSDQRVINIGEEPDQFMRTLSVCLDYATNLGMTAAAETVLTIGATVRDSVVEDATYRVNAGRTSTPNIDAFLASYDVGATLGARPRQAYQVSLDDAIEELAPMFRNRTNQEENV